MTPCYSEPPAELSPLNCPVHLFPKSGDEEGSWGGGLIPGLKSEDSQILSGTQTAPYFLSLSLKCQGYPKNIFGVKSLISA